jgi:hypothetical protein
MKTKLFRMFAGIGFFASVISEYALEIDFPLAPLAWLLIGVVVMLTSSAHAQVNTWTNLASGSTYKWEDGVNWSQGVPPSFTQSGVFVTNAASNVPDPTRSRVVNIDATTSGSYSSTLTVSNLTVSAPKIGSFSSFNTLVLNNAGSTTPLHILNTCTISIRGTISITNSVL